MTTPAETTILTTTEYSEWYEAQPAADRAKVDEKVALLRQQGVRLDHPYTSTTASTLRIRELRVQPRGKSVIRVFYWFTPSRAALLLAGWNKKGEDTRKNRDRAAAEAERILARWLNAQAPR